MREIETLQRGDDRRRQVEELSQVVRQVKAVPERRQRGRDCPVEVVGNGSRLARTERLPPYGLVRTLLVRIKQDDVKRSLCPTRRILHDLIIPSAVPLVASGRCRPRDAAQRLPAGARPDHPDTYLSATTSPTWVVRLEAQPALTTGFEELLVDHLRVLRPSYPATPTTSPSPAHQRRRANTYKRSVIASGQMPANFHRSNTLSCQ